MIWIRRKQFEVVLPSMSDKNIILDPNNLQINFYHEKNDTSNRFYYAQTIVKAKSLSFAFFAVKMYF